MPRLRPGYWSLSIPGAPPGELESSVTPEPLQWGAPPPPSTGKREPCCSPTPRPPQCPARAMVQNQFVSALPFPSFRCMGLSSNGSSLPLAGRYGKCYGMSTDMPTRAATDLDLIRGTLGDPKTGVLGAVVPNGQVFIPGGPVTFAPLSTLRWEVRGASFKVPDREMFDSFIGLWQEPGSDERIRQFAESWGPLAIQRDGTHLGADKWERIDSEVGWYGWDSLAVWKYFSRRAYSVLKIATELQHGRRGNEREWLMLSSPQKAGREPTCPQAPFGFGNWARRELVNIRRREYGKELSLEGLKGIIAGEISVWLERFGVKLQVTWAPRFNWQLEISFQGWLLSAVALQLALAVMHADGLYVCSECTRLYARSGKRPNAGEKNYCPDCGRPKAVENAGRRLRQRRAEARRLHRIEGKSATEIAKLLGVRKVETVRGWIAKGKRDAQKQEAQTTQARPR